MYDHAQRRREMKSLRESIRKLGDTDSLRKTALQNTLKRKADKRRKKWGEWKVFAVRREAATRILPVKRVEA